MTVDGVVGKDLGSQQVFSSSINFDAIGEVQVVFFFSSGRRHTSCTRDWSSDVCSSDLEVRGLDARDVLFARAVDVEHEDAVRALECARKVVHQRVQARVAMRLEDYDQPS